MDFLPFLKVVLYNFTYNLNFIIVSYFVKHVKHKLICIWLSSVKCHMGEPLLTEEGEEVDCTPKLHQVHCPFNYDCIKDPEGQWSVCCPHKHTGKTQAANGQSTVLSNLQVRCSEPVVGLLHSQNYRYIQMSNG